MACRFGRLDALYRTGSTVAKMLTSSRLYSRFRDELLNGEVFTSVWEARVIVEEYRRDYSTERPHSSLGYQTPSAFVIAAQRQPLNSVNYVGL